MSANPQPLQTGHNRFNVEEVRKAFPILHQEVHGKPLVYLDNAATAQKPQVVIDTVRSFYECDNAAVHRSVHSLSERSTMAYEHARDCAARFINAPDRKEVVFVRGTTEGINLVAHAYARPRLAPGDEIVVSHMEHHSNIVPWQILAKHTGAKVRVIPVTDEGVLDLDAYRELLGPKTRVVALNHVANALGTINPVAEVAQAAHDVGAVVVVDGAQAAPHIPVDVQALGADFYALSSHKVYGPTGAGVLWGREALLEEMEPYQGGGEMILTVTFDETTYNVLPHKFEAGTPNVAGSVGMAAAFEYLMGLDWDAVMAHEDDVLRYATEKLGEVPGVRIIGTAPQKTGVLSFVVDGVHPHDIGTVVDREGVAIRTGHHCAMPLMQRFDVPATSRASFGLYNTYEDADRLVAAIAKVQAMFAR